MVPDVLRIMPYRDKFARNGIALYLRLVTNIKGTPRKEQKSLKTRRLRKDILNLKENQWLDSKGGSRAHTRRTPSAADSTPRTAGEGGGAGLIPGGLPRLLNKKGLPRGRHVPDA